VCSVVVGSVVVGWAFVGRGAAVVGVFSCFFVAVELFMVALDALWVALMLPVTCGELDGVSEAGGNWAAVVVVGAAVAERALVVGVGPEEPVMRTDIDVAGVSGTVAQFDPLGIGTRALLTATTAPMKPNAATLPSRPMRSDLDCIAYQSSSLSALVLRNTLSPPEELRGAIMGARGGSGRKAAFDAGSPSAARRARCSLTPDPPRSVGVTDGDILLRQRGRKRPA
jgi:hypothetical protein